MKSKSVFLLGLFFSFSIAAFSQVSFAGSCDSLKPNQAAFFQHANYKGSCVVRNIGRYSSGKAIGIGNDKISSIKLGSGTHVVLCKDSNFKGTCKTYVKSMTSIGKMNDKTSSAIIVKTVPKKKTVKEASVSCRPSANQVAFFQHGSYKGACVVRNIGRYSSSKAIGIGNDKISSIKVGPRTQVSLCNDSNFKGGCKTYKTSMASLGKMNDKTSSAIIAKITSTPATSAACKPRANQVAFFQHANYKGACVVRNIGRYANAKAIGLGNDKISSIKIGPSTQVNLCKHSNFMGGCKTYTTSMASIGKMNDKTSSALIEKRSAPNNTSPSKTSQIGFNLKGDTKCRWGSKDCNRCVNDVKANFNAIETQYNGQRGNKMRVRSYAYPTKNYLLHRINSKWGYEHIQGVGRIAGVGNNEYLVFTHSTMSDNSGKNGALAVVRMGANQTSNGFELGDLRDGAGKNQNIHNRTVARTYTGSNHPGGVATLGHFVFVADWCQDHGKYDWCNNPSQYAFEVYDVSNVDKNAHKINSSPPLKIVDRSVFKIGDPKRDKSLASVAATRLHDGRYFVGVGRSGGKNYEYFLSDSTRLSRNTKWSSVSDVEPISKWGEGAAMVNECGSGDVYLIQMEKSTDSVVDSARGRSKDELHLFKLRKDRARGRIIHQYINSRTFKCSDGTAWCDFDKGTGIYITPTGNLYVYATDAQQAKKTERFRMVEFGNYLEAAKLTRPTQFNNTKPIVSFEEPEEEMQQVNPATKKPKITVRRR